MFERLKYNFERRRAARAGRRKVSVERAIADFERYHSFPGFGDNARRAGKTLHVRSSEGKVFSVVHEEERHSCYEMPKPSTIESTSDEDRGTQYNVYALPGQRFYE